MKKFTFPLNRVMDWRRTEQRLVEAELERIHGELRTLALSRARLDADERDAGRALLAAPSVEAEELAAWEDYRRWVGSEHRRLDAREAQARAAAEKVTAKLLERRRDVKLLERLKQKKHHAWEAGFYREVEEQAGEAFLARWRSA